MDTKNRGGRPLGSTKLAIAWQRGEDYGKAAEALDKLKGEDLATFHKAVCARVMRDDVAVSIVRNR